MSYCPAILKISYNSHFLRDIWSSIKSILAYYLVTYDPTRSYPVFTWVHNELALVAMCRESKKCRTVVTLLSQL